MILLDTNIDKKLNRDCFQVKSGPKYWAFCLPKIVHALADSKTEVTLVQNQCGPLHRERGADLSLHCLFGKTLSGRALLARQYELR